MPDSTSCIGEKPVTAFEEGKWYRWVGPKTRPNGWNIDGEMDKVLDGKPHRLVKMVSAMEGLFDVTPRRETDFWDWRYGFEFFREVPAPTHSGRISTKTTVTQGRDAVMLIGQSRIAVGLDAPWSSRCSPPVSARVALRRKLLGL
jgi:hypothetical protein